jgi:hypothetical protein
VTLASRNDVADLYFRSQFCGLFASMVREFVSGRRRQDLALVLSASPPCSGT